MNTIKNILESIFGIPYDSNGWHFCRFVLVWSAVIIALKVYGDHLTAKKKQELLRKHGIEMSVDDIHYFKPVIVVEGGKITFKKE